MPINWQGHCSRPNTAKLNYSNSFVPAPFPFFSIPVQFRSFPFPFFSVPVLFHSRSFPFQFGSVLFRSRSRSVLIRSRSFPFQFSFVRVPVPFLSVPVLLRSRSFPFPFFSIPVQFRSFRFRSFPFPFFSIPVLFRSRSLSVLFRSRSRSHFQNGNGTGIKKTELNGKERITVIIKIKIRNSSSGRYIDIQYGPKNILYFFRLCTVRVNVPFPFVIFYTFKLILALFIWKVLNKEYSLFFIRDLSYRDFSIILNCQYF